MKTLIKIILIILALFMVACCTIKPNIMIGPTGEAQETYIENIKTY